MADKGTVISGYWQRLGTRERFIATVMLLAVLSALIYQVPYAMMVRSVNSLTTGLVEAKNEHLAPTAQTPALNGRAAEIKAGGPIALRGRELVDQKGVVLFLEDVAG